MRLYRPAKRAAGPALPSGIDAIGGRLAPARGVGEEETGRLHPRTTARIAVPALPGTSRTGFADVMRGEVAETPPVERSGYEWMTSSSSRPSGEFPRTKLPPHGNAYWDRP